MAIYGSTGEGKVRLLISSVLISQRRRALIREKSYITRRYVAEKSRKELHPVCNESIAAVNERPCRSPDTIVGPFRVSAHLCTR